MIEEPHSQYREQNIEMYIVPPDRRMLEVLPQRIQSVIQKIRGVISTLVLLEETLKSDLNPSLPLIVDGDFDPKRCFVPADHQVTPLLTSWARNMLLPGSGAYGANNLKSTIEASKKGERVMALGRHIELAGIPFLKLICNELGESDFFDNHLIFLTGQKLSTEEAIPSNLIEVLSQQVKPSILQKPFRFFGEQQFPQLASIRESQSIFPTLMGLVHQFRFFTKKDDLSPHLRATYLRQVANYMKETDPWKPYHMLVLYPMAGCERGRPPVDVDENFVNMIFRGTPLTPPIDRVFLFNEGGEIAGHPNERGKNLLTINPHRCQKRMGFTERMTPTFLLDYLLSQGHITSRTLDMFIQSQYRKGIREIAIGVERAIRAIPLSSPGESAS